MREVSVSSASTSTVMGMSVGQARARLAERGRLDLPQARRYLGVGVPTKAWTDVTAHDKGRIFRISVVDAKQPETPSARRISTKLLVPYSQMAGKLQEIHRIGGRVSSIAPV